MKLCQVDGCERAYKALDLCQMHYLRVRKHGEVGPPEQHPAGGRIRKRAVPSDPLTRLCNLCLTRKTEDQFSAYLWTHSTEKATCRDCATYRAFAIRYGLDTGEVMQFVWSNERVCSICGTSNTPVLDHCHRTLKIRGWLCHKHNLLLGMASDDPDVLMQAIKYLAERG